MRTIKVAFYKNSKTYFGKLITWKQGRKFPQRYARYSHVELVFEDGLSFSSSEVDKGVRFKEIDFNHDNWDFVILEMPDRKYEKILKWCKKQEGNSYNWWGIFWAQGLNVYIKGNGDWFCSEICCRALQEGHYLCTHSSLFMEPAELAWLLEKRRNIIIKD